MYNNYITMSPENNLSSLESIVKPLLEAASTTHWRNSLNVLYLSGHVMAFSEELQFPCIISARGPYDEVESASDLLKGKTEVAITKIGKDSLPIIMPVITSLLKQEELRTALEEDREEKLVKIFIDLYSSQFQKMQDEFFQIFISGASTIADWITPELYENLLEMREKMIRSAFYDDEYEEMVDSLLKLNLIKPRLQINLCPRCADYQITLTKTATILENCPNCGVEWASVTLFTFIHPYNEIKKNNSDLPLFISSYLKHKIVTLYPAKELEIFPMAKVSLEDGTIFDIDVYIPEYDMGFECKVFEDAYARMTSSRINSLVGGLLPQIHRYFDAGIQKVFIVTNLVESSSNKVERLLKRKLSESGYPSEVELLAKDYDKLLKWLDEKAQLITNQRAKLFTKSLEIKNGPEKLE